MINAFNILVTTFREQKDVTEQERVISSLMESHVHMIHPEKLEGTNTTTSKLNVKTASRVK